MTVQSTFIWANYLLPTSAYCMIYLWWETERENWSLSLLGVKGPSTRLPQWFVLRSQVLHMCGSKKLSRTLGRWDNIGLRCKKAIKYSSKVWRHHFAIFSIRTFEPRHAIYTAAVRRWEKFQIANINEGKDTEVWSFTQSHTNLSYLGSVPNFRNKH